MEEENGISIGELFKIIFRRIWWVVGVVAAAVIIFVCVVNFWYNPDHREYAVQYSLRLPCGGTYPDGTALRVSDSVLLANLLKVKEEALTAPEERTGEFANVDVEKMVGEDDISFEQVITELDDKSYDYRFEIKVAAKYFDSKEQAVDFVKAVVEYPIDNAKYIVANMNYTANLANYDDAETYSEKIGMLVDQKQFVLNIFDSLKSLYGGDYVPVGLNNKTINDYIVEATNIFRSQDQSALYDMIDARFYVYDTERYVSEAQDRIAVLEKDIADNQNIIDALIAERTALLGDVEIRVIEAYDTKIASYTETNAQKQNSIDTINKTLDAIRLYTVENESEIAKKAEFDRSLEEYRAQLIQESEVVRSVQIATYEDKAAALYVNNKIEAEGGIRIFVAAILGAVVGFVLVSAVILIVDLPRIKRAKKGAASEGEERTEPSDGEQSEN